MSAISKRPVDLSFNMMMRMWKVCIDWTGEPGYSNAARIVKAIKALPWFHFNRRKGTADLKQDEIPEEVILNLKPKDISWYWGEEMKRLDKKPSPGIVDQVEEFAISLGYSKDKAFLDKVARYRVDDEDEDGEDEDDAGDTETETDSDESQGGDGGE